MEDNFMDDEKLAPEGGDAEGATADAPPPQPSPDAEDADQQQQPIDPFADLTYETAREHFADRFEEEAGQRQEQGRREGQGEARTEIAAIRKKIKGEEADRITYERLERMKHSDDPEGKEAYWHERDNSETDAAYKRGKKAVSEPPPEVREQMTTEIADGFLTNLDAHLNDRKELQGISDEEKGGLAKEHHSTLGKLVDAKIELAIKRGIAAGVTKENAQKLTDAKEEAEKELLDKLGIDQPDEITEGHPPKPDTDGVLASSTATGEAKVSAFEKKHGYPPKGR